jgi:hypothetical protein
MTWRPVLFLAVALGVAVLAICAAREYRRFLDAGGRPPAAMRWRP